MTCKHSHTSKGTQILPSLLSQIGRHPRSQRQASGGTGCQSSGGLAAGWVRGQMVVVGATAGRWEIEEQAQHKESGAAPPLQSPVGTTTLVTLDPAEANAGDAIAQRPQPAGEQVATGGSFRGEGNLWRY